MRNTINNQLLLLLHNCFGTNKSCAGEDVE